MKICEKAGAAVAIIYALRDRVQELEELLGAGASSERYRVLGLAGRECQILGHLVRREVASRIGLMILLYGGDADVSEKVVDVYVVAVRKVLRRHGITLRTHKGVGWSLSGEDKRKLEEIMRSTCT